MGCDEWLPHDVGHTVSPLLASTSSATPVHTAAVTTAATTAAAMMLEDGDGACSSIVLACPAWDGRWGEWHEAVFPVLEEAVVAGELLQRKKN